MTRRPWARLDNASNIFLAARSEVDTKVFRISAEFDHEVDPILLQDALDETYDRYPLYHSVLRSGVFWYYLQESSLRPRVSTEQQHTCAPIYQHDRRTLLFRVLHHRRRVILEIFHALSDGTGALWFISDLAAAYARRRSGSSAPDHSTRGPVLKFPANHGDPAEMIHELSVDGFRHHFRHRWVRVEPEAATSAGSGGGTDASPAAPAVHQQHRRRLRDTFTRILHATTGRVHRVRGTRTPDNRTRLVELTMPASAVLGLARAEGVSLTMYLTALFFESIRASTGGLGQRRTIAASVPVNLRQFFPSDSARNFFATVRIQHRYGEGDDSVGAVARRLEAQFRPMASPTALERKLRKLIRFERMAVLRVVPRGLKDVLLGLINHGNNRGLTVAVSNLGRVTLPEPAEQRVGRMLFHVSAVRPQFCAMSHAGQLTISFTSPFVETAHVREFARHLTERGIDISVAAARATEAELAEARLVEAE
ncbi:alcohol acetyltransferase [Leucobacter sp. GX24907]